MLKNLVQGFGWGKVGIHKKANKETVDKYRCVHISISQSPTFRGHCPSSLIQNTCTFVFVLITMGGQVEIFHHFPY